MVALRIKITPDPKTVADKLRRLRQDTVYDSIARLAQKAGQIILDALITQAPSRTGLYAESLHMAQVAGEGSLTLSFRGANPLSTWIINGTQPHSIDPVEAGGVLRFLSSSGDVVFARHVEHPGTQPNNFPARAWEEVAGSVAEIFLPLGKDIIEVLT